MPRDANKKKSPRPPYPEAPRSAKPLPLSPKERSRHRRNVKRLDRVRPRSRDECRYGPRPCPFVACRYHLYLDVNEENGHIKWNFPGLEVEELEVTCALDVAEALDGVTLEKVGGWMNLTRERIRQIEAKAIVTLTESGAADELLPFVEDD